MSEEITDGYSIYSEDGADTKTITKDDFDTLRIQVLIGICCVITLIVILIITVSILFWQLKKLQRLVNVLDPMSHYKKVTKSVYVKKHERASVSSSFHMFNSGWENLDTEKSEIKNNSNPKDAGTLDRNFLTRSYFQFQNPLSRPAILENEARSPSQNRSEDAKSDQFQAHIAQDKLFY